MVPSIRPCPIHACSRHGLTPSNAEFRELCREFGISRKTGYKWLERFHERGFEGLVDHALEEAAARIGVAVAANDLTRAHARAPESSEEAASSSGSRLDDPGVAQDVIVEQPNDLWTVDFKGWWTTRDGRRCEPLTVRDAFSRFILALRILPRADTDGVRAVFEELFGRHGLPKTIQSDNGAPFAAGRSLAGLTKLSAWWISLGIDVVAPGATVSMAAPKKKTPNKPTDDTRAIVSKIAISASPALSDAARLAIAYPLHTECDNGLVTVRGFLDAQTDQLVALAANGRPIAVAGDSSFAATVPFSAKDTTPQRGLREKSRRRIAGDHDVDAPPGQRTTQRPIGHVGCAACLERGPLPGRHPSD